MEGKKIRLSVYFAALLFASLSASASAAVIELSGLVAYSKSDFADGYKSTQRRYTGSIDFKFTPVSALQFEYTESRTNVSYLTRIGTLLPYATRQHVTYYDRIYSFNWVQNLVPSKWIVQPYVVIGGGRMIRNIKQEIPEYGYSDSATQRVTTGTGGVGLRIFLTKNMAVKGEAKTYVPSFRFSKWKESQMFSAGLSWLF